MVGFIEGEFLRRGESAVFEMSGRRCAFQRSLSLSCPVPKPGRASIYHGGSVSAREAAASLAAPIDRGEHKGLRGAPSPWSFKFVKFLASGGVCMISLRASVEATAVLHAGGHSAGRLAIRVYYQATHHQAAAAAGLSIAAMANCPSSLCAGDTLVPPLWIVLNIKLSLSLLPLSLSLSLSLSQQEEALAFKQSLAVRPFLIISGFLVLLTEYMTVSFSVLGG